MRLYRIRNTPAQTRLSGLQETPELQDDATLTGVHDVKPAGQPDHGPKGSNQSDPTPKLAKIEFRKPISTVPATSPPGPT